MTGVLETHLAKQPAGQDGPWLVGGKMSYADGMLDFLLYSLSSGFSR